MQKQVRALLLLVFLLVFQHSWVASCLFFFLKVVMYSWVAMQGVAAGTSRRRLIAGSFSQAPFQAHQPALSAGGRIWPPGAVNY